MKSRRDMRSPLNPFFTGTDIPDEFFCDRVEETSLLIRHIRNGSNVVLKAPRRIGKSSLLWHLFRQKDIVDNFNTLFVDIYGTKNAGDFQDEFQRELLSAPFAKKTKLLRDFEAFAKGAYLSMGKFNAVTADIDLPKIGFSPQMQPRIPLNGLFDLLERTSKPNIVVFDEFQQIEEYPERMAAILRSFVQKMNNTRFIFSGSSRHMLTTMFQISNQAFYKSATPMDLDILSLEAYTDFCKRMFAYGNRSIEDRAVAFAYHLFSGETYLLQETMKETYAGMQSGETADIEVIKMSVNTLIHRKDGDFRDIMNRLDNSKERNTLTCIALEGVAKGLTSAKIMKQYGLDNASSVQNALNNLGVNGLGLVEPLVKGVYVVQDRLFELWIAKRYGFLESKYTTAEERFDYQRGLSV